MEDTVVITTAAQKVFDEKEEAQKVVEKVAVKKQKIADDALTTAKKIDTEAFAQQSTDQKLKAVKDAKAVTDKAQKVATEAKKKAETKVAEKVTAVVYA
jgi:membrane protein involved in colicin uptake